jgi:MFS family permease
MGLMGGSVVGYYKIIATIFSRHRGKAFGLFTLEATLVGALMPLFMNTVLDQWGWRAIFIALAAVKLLVAVPILLLWLKDPTEEVRREAAANSAQPVTPSDGMTVVETLKSAPFWMIFLANLGGGLTINGLMPNLVAMANAQGLGRGSAAVALRFMALFIAIGRLTAGFVVDRVHTAKVAAAYLLLFPIGIFLLSGASPSTGPLPLFAGMAMMGIGGGAQDPMQSYFFSRFFGNRAFAQNLGVFRAIQSLLTAPAPAIIGLIFDRTGHYDLAYAMFLASAAVSITMFLLMPRYRYAAARS